MTTIASKIYHIAMYSLFMDDNNTTKKEAKIDLGTDILECTTSFIERSNSSDPEFCTTTDAYLRINCKIRNKQTGEINSDLSFDKLIIEFCSIEEHLETLEEYIENIHTSSEEEKQEFIYSKRRFCSTKPYVGGKSIQSSNISNEVEHQINAKYGQIMAKYDQMKKQRKQMKLQVKQSRKAKINRFTYNKLCNKSNYQIYCLAMKELLFTDNDITDLGTHILEYYPCFIQHHNDKNPYSIQNDAYLALSVKLRNKQTNQIEWEGLYSKRLIPNCSSLPEEAILEAEKLFEELKESTDRKKMGFILQSEPNTHGLPFRGPQASEQEYQIVLSYFNNLTYYDDTNNISLGVGFPIALMPTLDAKFEETRMPKISHIKRKGLSA